MIEPRDYQLEAVECVFKRWKAYKSTLLVAATGTGKSACAGLIAQQIPTERRLLILVNRTELLFQFQDTLRGMLPQDVIELEAGEYNATHPGDRGMKKEYCGRIVVAMIQTMAQRRRLLSWKPTEFSHIICDEFHHATITNSSYRHVLEHFREYKLCGMTATPDRLDGVSLSGFCESVAYNYDIGAAIRDGWLVPVQQYVETVVGWDLSQLKRKNGDFHVGDLDTTLNQEKPSQAIASAAIKHSEAGGSRKPCLIFAVSVAHAHLIADILNRPRDGEERAGRALALDGKVDREERREQLKRFKRGEFQYLVGADLFLEGFDEDTIEVIVMGRPTQSRARFAQMIGRGTRVHCSVVQKLNAAKTPEERRLVIRESPKPCLKVVDMVGVSSENKLVVDCTDILGGWLPKRVRDVAKDLIRDGLGKPDVDEALKEAIRVLDEKEKERRRGLVLLARLESREVDPFDLMDIRPKREPLVLRGKPATDRQRSYLQSKDIPVPKNLSFWSAKTLIDAFVKKQNEGPPTEAQAKLLLKFGFTPDTMNFQSAKKAIDELAANGWKVGGIRS